MVPRWRHGDARDRVQGMQVPTPHDAIHSCHGCLAAIPDMFDGLPVGLSLLDQELTYVSINRWLAAMHDLPVEAHLGRPMAEAMPDLFRQIEPFLRQALAGQPVDNVEARIPAKPERYLLGSYRPVLGNDGVKGVMISVQDITERKAMEAALRESEDHYRHAVELSAQMPWTADPDGTLLEVGPRWLDAIGVTQDELLGTGWLKQLHPDDVAPTMQAWATCLATGEPADIEYRVRLADDSYRWFRARGAARRNAAGRIIRWYGSVEDVHDHKAANVALRESEMRFRALADDSPVMIWVVDPTGATTFLNRLWYETTGQTEAEAQGMGWTDAIHPEDRDAVSQTFLAAFVQRERFRVEYRLRRADGSWAWVIDDGRPRFASDGTFLGYVGSLMDITERRSAELALRESEAFARSILDSSTDCMKVLDLDGNLLFMNGPGLRAIEIDDFETLRGKPWPCFWPPEGGATLMDAVARARAGETVRFTGFCPTATGKPRWWDISVCPIPGPDGRPARLLATSRDVTDAKRLQDEAEATAARLSAVLESTTDCVAVLDRDWRFIYLNSRAVAMIAGGRELLGVNAWEAFPEAVGSTFERHYREAFAHQVPVVFEEFLPALGMWLEVHVFPAPDSLSIFFRDVTDRRRSEERLEHMARHDDLTGLANRTRLREDLQRALDHAERGTLTAVFCLDLDEFKAINDTLGHAAGDQLLMETGKRLRDGVGSADTIARIGGDEFAIVQTGLDHPEQATTLAQRILAAFREPYTLDDRSVIVDTSVGIALASHPGMQVVEVLKSADIALHRAKAEGPGSFCVFEPGMDERILERQALKDNLRGAVQRGEFTLVYQPLVDLQTLRISGFEALVRWCHPSRGIISPADFIPLAEEIGAIVELGAWVVHRACQDAVSWPDGVAVAVNLSPVQFRSPVLVKTVAAALADSGLAPARLQLEITESVLLQDSAANLAVLHNLRRLGVKIALDDFGTGYSSLSYLRSFPFDKIKIDRSFVGDLPDGAESRAIVDAVVGLGHSLGIATTAEGVETREQMEGLRERGCSEGQGFLFSPPVPASDVPSVTSRLHDFCAAFRRPERLR